MSTSLLKRLLGLGAVACVLAVGAHAEVKVGDKAAEIKADKILNSKLKSLKEVRGSLVLYEYFAYW